MLQELNIRNFAIIEQLQLSFSDGMTVLTGETGAGKSIIIDAVSLLLGARGSADYIRSGAEKCQLEALFMISDEEGMSEKLQDLGIEPDEMLIIQREIFKNGRNVCRINGQLVNTSMLRQIGPDLVDIQGQYDQQKLMQEENHVTLLDSYGGIDLEAKVQDYQFVFHRYQKLKEKIHHDEAHAKDFAQRMDMLRFQRQEIENAELKPEEEETLREERTLLRNATKIHESLEESYQLLSGDNFVLSFLSIIRHNLQKISDWNSEYATIQENVDSAYYLLQECSADILQQMEQLSADPNRLEEVESRLQQIRNLERKYGSTIPEILSYYDEITKEWEENCYDEDHIEIWKEELLELKKEVEQKGQALQNLREKVAYSLEQEVEKQLKDLYMPHAQFKVEFLPWHQGEWREEGLSRVAFYISTNKGEPFHPLAKVLSGGELSRLLLALKVIFHDKDAKTSIVFDEVDTGVSGRVASAIAQKIYQIGRDAQVLCITHLPQVAAIADHQFYISKVEEEGRVETKVQVLSAEERIKEIARMMTGEEVTELSLQHADELLQLSQKEREIS